MKRNFIQLTKVDKDGNSTGENETYLTPAFIPLRKMYQAIDIEAEGEKGNVTEKEQFDMMIDFVVEIYDKQFKRDDVLDRLHAPDAVGELQAQIQFVAQGQMDDERKKQLAKMT